MRPASSGARSRCESWGGVVLLLSWSVVTSCSAPVSPATENEAQRLLEIETLERRGRPEDIAVVEAHLEDSSWRVRTRAVRALGRLGDVVSDRVPGAALLSLLADGEEVAGVRTEAWFALELLGVPAAGLQLVPDNDSEARVAQARWLARALPSGLGSKLKEWVDDSEPRVRRAALLSQTLALATDTASVNLEPAVASDARLPRSVYADETDERVRWALFWQQAWRPERQSLPVSELLRAAVEPNFFSAFFALSSLRDRAETFDFHELLTVADRADVPWLQREAAWHTLAVVLEHPTLSTQLRDPICRSTLQASQDAFDGSVEPLLRRRIVFTLARCRTEASQRWLMEKLADGAGVGEVTAALASVAESSPSSVGDDTPAERAALDLLERLRSRSEESIRVAWTRASLRWRGNPALDRALADPLGAVRACGARAASELSPAQTMALLQDSDPQVPQALLWRWLERGELPAAQSYGALLSRRAPAEWPLRLLALSAMESGARSGLPLSPALLSTALTDPVYEVARRARSLSSTWGETPPAAFFLTPYPFPRGVEREAVRHLRADVRLRGGGRFLIELLPQEAPYHVAAFVSLARAGFYNGLRARRLSAALGCVLTEGVPETHALAAHPLPREPHPREILRGAVFSLPAAWELPESLARMRRQTNAGVTGPSRAGSLSVAHLPLPALRGIVTVWGRVVQGMAVIDRLDETDAVDSVDVTGWDLAPFLAAHSDSE